MSEISNFTRENFSNLKAKTVELDNLSHLEQQLQYDMEKKSGNSIAFRQ